MKKRLLSILLALCVVLTLLPGTALADTEEGTIITASGAELSYYAWYSYTESKVIMGISGCNNYIDGNYITTVEVPEQINGYTVTEIYSRTFFDCANLISVIFPATINFYGYGDNLSADPGGLGECPDLQNITVKPGGTYFSENGILYSNVYRDEYGNQFNGEKCMVCYPAGRTDSTFVVPNGVVMLANAFSNCQNLTSVILPDSLISIGGGAFLNCTKLSSITIPSNVNVIGWSAFYNCSSLSSIVIPNKVTSIYNYAFENCSSLTNITIPDSITNIGAQAFNGCNSLTDVYYSGTKEQWDEIFIDSGNEPLTSANIHCSGVTQPSNEITLRSDDNFTVNVGDKITILASIPNASGLQQSDITWSISDDSIATIESSSVSTLIDTMLATVVIRGVSLGTAALTVEVSDGRTNSIDVQVIRSDDISAYYITPMNFGDLVINNSGEAIAWFYVKDEHGTPVCGKNLQYIINGETGSTTVTTDSNGLVGVVTPYLTRSAGFYVVFSTDNGIDVYNEGQYFDVTVKELSYSQEWTGVYKSGLNVGLGSLIGVESPVGLEISMDLSKAITVKDEYDGGQRTLTLDFANKGGDTLQLQTGLSTKLSNQAKAKLVGASAQATLSEQANGGLKIENYDPTNIEHLRQVGMFAIVPVTYTSSVLWNKAFEKVVADVYNVDICNTEAHEIGFGLKGNASVGSLEIAGIKSDIWGYSSASAWKWTDSYDYTGSTTYKTSKSLKVSAGEGLGAGLGITNEGADGSGDDKVEISATGKIGGYAYGYSVSNSKEISAKRSATSEDFDSISFKIYSGDEQNYAWNSVTTDTYASVTYSGDDAKNIFKSNPDLVKWANGKNPFINIQDAINNMNTTGNIGLVSETSKDKEIVEFSFPIGVDFGVSFGINFGVSGEHSFSWCNATGALYNNTVYTTCVSNVDKNQIISSADSLDDLFWEAANTVLAEMVKNIVTKSGRVSDGVRNDTLEVTGDHDVWVVVLNTIPSNNATRSVKQEESYTILSLSSETGVEDTITAFSSVGNPYEITVYTDDSQTTLVTDEELAESPVTLVFHYTTEMLESADAEEDAEVMLLRYDRENDIYICVSSAVQDKQNMTVTADMTKSGEYILAVDLPDIPTYIVTFDANGGNTTAATMSTNEYGQLSTLPTAFRESYIFNGWYTASIGGTKITVDTVFDQDTTVYAQWTYDNSNISNDTPYYPVGSGTSNDSNNGTSHSIIVPSSVTGGNITVNPQSAKKGDTVTIIVTPDSGYELDYITVTDRNGNDIPLTDCGNGKYVFTMPGGNVTLDCAFSLIKTDSPEPPVVSFIDVVPGVYYYDAVAWAVAQGITNGTTATTFSPDAPCTRGQIVTFLWRAAGSPSVSGNNPFTDVQSGDYWYDAILWAVSTGITDGTSVTTFSPNDICTRGQAMTFLYRNAGSPATISSITFTDVAPDAYYSKAVAWALANDITNGTTTKTFSPEDQCTRGQIVTFLYRTFGE